MEEKKPLFGTGSTETGTKPASKGLIFSKKNASFGSKPAEGAAKDGERTASAVGGNRTEGTGRSSGLIRSGSSAWAEKPAAPVKTEPAEFERTEAAVPARKEHAAFARSETEAAFDRTEAAAPVRKEPAAPVRTEAPAPEKKNGFGTVTSGRFTAVENRTSVSRPVAVGVAKGFGTIKPTGGPSKFGVIGAEHRTSKLIVSNRQNKPVISSAFFLAINGNGETRVLPVLNGMLIGSVWANSTVPDIALSSDADRKQGEIFLEDGRIWLKNYSKRCTLYRNDEQPETDRFEITIGDVVRIHSAFDLARTNDTVLILLDRIPEGLTWDRIQVDKAGSETVQLVRADDPTMQSVFFAYQKGRFAVSHFSGLKGFSVNNRPGELNRTLSPMDVVCIDGTYFICLLNAIVCQTQWQRKVDPAKKAPVVRPGGLQIAIRERTVRKGLGRREALLRDIRLFIPKGNLVLILGGSGAGKTTFINAVMGYEPADGVIKYDDIDIYREYEKMKYAIGYVQQEDLLRRTDVVSETLKDAAKMHLACSKAEQNVAVAETMKLLGLEKEKDKLVGQLSGGQRKRLSIGVEYVGEPLLFFLDEPDSGLDGSNADNMWDIVRKIADTGKIVMVISHIPDRAYDLFDKVIVLAKDRNNTGRLAFAGSPDDACEFFGTERLEEIVKKVNRVNEGGEGRADEFINRFAEAGYGRI